MRINIDIHRIISVIDRMAAVLNRLYDVLKFVYKKTTLFIHNNMTECKHTQKQGGSHWFNLRNIRHLPIT